VTRTIKQWQEDAYACARSKGFHDCKTCDGEGDNGFLQNCPTCNGTGLAPLTPTRIGARLAAVHAEISEAYECVARGRMGVYFERKDGACVVTHGDDKNYWAELLERGFKPEGFGIELADVFLRLCDLAESLGVQILENEPVGGITAQSVDTAEKLAAELNTLHYVLADWTNEPADTSVEQRWGSALTATMLCLRRLATACNVDLLAMAELKHAWNLTRPLMHGKIL
jgi:hypothetical protein